MVANFIHLRCHSAYSLSEGAIKVPKLVSSLKDMNMPAAAITDTSNLFGSFAFSDACKANGVQPIIGTQINIRNEDSKNPMMKGRVPDPDQMVLLAQNKAGYQNLIKLLSLAYMNTPPGELPQIEIDDFKEYNEGVIALTGGIKGPIGRLILENRITEAKNIILKLKEYFDKNRLYIELMRLGLEEEIKTEPVFLEFAYDLNIPLVATNEVFFLNKDMHEAHDALCCIAGARYLDEEDRPRHSINSYLRSPEEMTELFKDIPEAIENTIHIAKRCGWMLEFVKPLLPPYDLGDGKTEDEYIREHSIDGLEKRLEEAVYKDGMSEEEKKEISKPYWERMEYELGIIKQMGFPGYFLIVADFIKWSKDHNIPVGPGRGSGAGSVVAWALTITDLDPLRFGLLFERFLNPERVSMPDFDVDFCQDKRGLSIQYVQEKYGADKVAQIITFGKLQAKAVVRDVGRVLHMPYSQVDKISKLIPGGPKQVSLQEAIDMEPEFKNLIETDNDVKKLIDIALKLEGLYRHAGMHAAGVVIGDRPLDNLVALYKDSRSEMPVTQFDMKYIENTGLIKFDFLGLKTLTVIQRAIEKIKRIHGVDIDISKISLEDKATFELLQRGETAGVFQFESAGMRDIHKQLKPDKFEDLIAIVSLYRPGPMENIPSYIRRKHGEEEPDYLHPLIEDILKETYGIMIYQEQVMQISQAMAGYSLGGADLLRRAMGKKKIEEMVKQRKIFIEGAIKNGVDEAKATQVFDLMEKFASYGFNKSHAAAYSLISYQTAYLKAHYPVEFMAAIMDLDLNNTDKLCFFKEEAKRMGIEVLQPDINKSHYLFKVEDGKIRYALSAIKNVGEANMKAIHDERKANGEFTSLTDFVRRLDVKAINKRQLENLIKAGAFDSMDPRRGTLYDNVDLMIGHANSAYESKNSNQTSLFGDDELEKEIKLKSAPDWPSLEKLKAEVEAVGFYLSAHPLDNYTKGLDRLGVVKSSELTNTISQGEKKRVKLAGSVNNLNKRINKKGNKYAFIEMSDASGAFEGVIFSETLSRSEELLESGKPILVVATAEKREDSDNLSFIINVIEDLDKAVSEVANGLKIYINSPQAVKPLKEVLDADSNGRNNIYIKPYNNEWDVEITLKSKYALGKDTLTKIRSIPGITDIKEL